MALPYVGEIKMFAGFRLPVGWLRCDGSLLPILEYETLFTLLGTTYGGDGQNTFSVPDLRGRIPIHQGQGSGLPNYFLGENGGVETVTLSAQQIGPHTHSVGASNTAGTAASPEDATWGTAPTNIYNTSSPATPMASTIVSIAGSSQPHSNVQPILCISFIISAFGIFPQQS
ncbi:MAG: phage tail protein [Pyrinomonadaceae bacterium]|nr:phage tail protein [Acidobacteriota bacterium]MBK7933607.1 phage tail protein [Acidobacteriota bacterium]MBP7375056.1 phage tail protein [Pyrinomonadaceae bacterium]